VRAPAITPVQPIITTKLQSNFAPVNNVILCNRTECMIRAQTSRRTSDKGSLVRPTQRIWSFPQRQDDLYGSKSYPPLPRSDMELGKEGSAVSVRKNLPKVTVRRQAASVARGRNGGVAEWSDFGLRTLLPILIVAGCLYYQPQVTITAIAVFFALGSLHLGTWGYIE